jgi:hypothetical protein
MASLVQEVAEEFAHPVPNWVAVQAAVQLREQPSAVAAGLLGAARLGCRRSRRYNYIVGHRLPEARDRSRDHECAPAAHWARIHLRRRVICFEIGNNLEKGWLGLRHYGLEREWAERLFLYE